MIWSNLQYLIVSCLGITLQRHNETKISFIKLRHCEKRLVGSHYSVVFTQDESFKCNFFTGVFSKSKYLVIHMKNHFWNKCDACTSGNFEFTCLTQLRKHVITHMDGKPYHCTICGKSFSSADTLRTHVITHMDSNPYHCTICGKIFSWADAINTHIVRPVLGGRHWCRADAFAKRRRLLRAVRKTSIEDTRFSLCNFPRTG
jgi:DNA-directed RNA polymerase subunit RPC12/RpoP